MVQGVSHGLSDKSFEEWICSYFQIRGISNNNSGIPSAWCTVTQKIRTYYYPRFQEWKDNSNHAGDSTKNL